MKRRLRVLHIGNGKAFKIRAIAAGLHERGHDIHMVPIPPSPPMFDEGTWHRLDSAFPGPLGTLHRALQVRSLGRRLKADVIHAHNAWGPGWIGAATGMHPFVIHAYGGDLLPEQYAGRPNFQRWLTAWACRSADRIVVTGKHMISAAERLGIAAERVVALPRGVDLVRYRPGLNTAGLRSSLGLQQTDRVVLSPRYQVDEDLYNLDIVVRAFADVRRRVREVICLQMYDPARPGGRDRLAAIAAANGLDRSYQLIPMVDNQTMPLYYNLAEVVVSVPSSDGFPVTVLEASACERPLVVTELPYSEEWFTQRQNGLIVPARDTSALVDAIVELLSDCELSRRIGVEGRKLVEERANYERCMDALESIYFQLLEARNN